MCVICQGGTASTAGSAVTTVNLFTAAPDLFAPPPGSIVAASGPDVGASTATAGALVVGQVLHGVLETAGDADWFRVDLVAGQTYTIAMVGTGTNNVRDTFLNLRNAAGTVVASDDDGLQGNNSLIRFTATTTGTHYIDARGYAASDVGHYGVSITQGNRASFDTAMGAGVIDTDSAWNATPGTSVTVTYGYRQTVGGGGQTGFSQLTTAEIAATEAVLALVSEYASITFSRVNPTGYTDNATILIGNYNADDGAGAYAYYPGSTAAASVAGDVWLNTRHVSTTSLPMGSYSYFVIMHELGHALGLSHPGQYNAAPGVAITYANNAQFVQDSHQYSIMSYFDESATGTNYASYPDTFMLFDVVALQAIYGANTSTRAGDTTYGYNTNAGATYAFSTNPGPAFTIWDGGGLDTIDASGHSGAQTINLQAGTFSSMRGLSNNISIAPGAVIENALGGGGADRLIGNEVGNRLAGSTGNDTLTGGAGNDTLDGGAGVDTIVYSGSGAVTVNLISNVSSDGLGGTDVLIGIENVTSGDGADTLYGSVLANVLDSGAGNDLISSRDGNDTIRCGDGDDTVNAGTGDDLIEGGAGIDRLSGTAGRDVLIGGLGKDYLVGGTEADVYRYLAAAESTVGAARDRITGFSQIEGDRIDLSAIDAIAGGTDDAFTWLAGAAFSGAAGQLRFSTTTAITLVDGDLNGDRIADFQIELTGVIQLTVSDFML
jgi:serralysin